MAIIIDKINYLWLDTETTGLDPVRNDVVQLAAIPVINGKQHHISFNEFCQPFDWNTIDDKALEINHTTREQLAKEQQPIVMVRNFIRYCKQFNVKFTIAGYNAEFDRNFLSNLFKKAGCEREFTEVFNGDMRDLYKRAKGLKSQLGTHNLKLGTLCEHFKITINAHDALSDIAATIELDKIMSKMLGDVDVYDSITEHVVDPTLLFKEPAQLHLHSKFSYTDSLPSIREYVEHCLKTGIPAFACPDHGMAASLFDMIRIPDIIKSINKDNKTDYKTDLITGVPAVGLHVTHGGQNFYINAWAVNNAGYDNLVKLASVGWENRVDIQNVEFPLLPLERVIAQKEGLVFGIPGVNGPTPSLIMEKRLAELENLIVYLNDNLDIRLELAALDVYKYFDSTYGFMSYNVAGGNIQKAINGIYFMLAKKHNIKCIPVSDAHFLSPEDKIIQDCVSKNSFKDSRYFFESRHLLNSMEMYTIIKSHIGAGFTEEVYNQLIENTYEIAQQAATIKVKHEYHLPEIQIPDNIKAKYPDYNTQTYMYMMERIKLHGRWNNSKEYVDRFKKEVDVIMKNDTLNFLPYFLVYEDVCDYVRENKFMQGIARGSAGGSLLSYYLKIIHVDPVATNLPFERFLSHARIRAGSFPDIDLDIADKARPMVIKYLQEKYGLGFAQISTFSRMKTKNAIKDSMYALYGRNRKDPEVEAVCNTIPDSPQGVDEWDFLYGYTDQEGVEHTGCIEANEMLRNFFLQRPEIEVMVQKLIGSIRGWSRHASAFVISTIDLASGRVPTMYMSDKELGQILVTQFDAPMVEKSGLVKADILGIKTLTMVSDCIKLIEARHNISFFEEEKGVPLVYRLPDEDEGVFVDFYKKDTDSSFQFNSGVIKGVATDFAPSKKEHLSIMTALMRPGAMDAQMDIGIVKNRDIIAKTGEHAEHLMSASDFYISVRKGVNDAFYIHPDLKPILEDTYGVIVYQEQVMEILVNICGYSLEETDTIRSAIAKKKQEVIMSAFARIRESTAARGWTEKEADSLCQQIQAFSRYSFNKSHSHAYAELGYITMYFKHHYPLEWWASVLNNEEKEDKIRSFIVRLADKVSPPSIKHPSSVWTIKDGKLIAPISAIKGVGPAVVNELTAKGPFDSLEDFVARIDHSRVNIGAMTAFIKARAADYLMDDSIEDYLERRQAFMIKYRAIRKSKTEFKEELINAGHLDIFLHERESNEAFNKSLLSTPELVNVMQSRWPGLRKTGSSKIPLVMGKSDDPSELTYILPDIKAAQTLLESNATKGKKLGMIVLFQESSFAQGISKKSGKPWKKLSVIVSDGYNTMECVWWDRTKPLRYKKNSIIYVYGEIIPGWKTPVSMKVDDIQEVE